MTRRTAPLNTHAALARPSRRRRRLDLLGSRRGVVSVVSMMFLILFGSLAAAMAIMSRGNITTAATHQHVMRAQGAAETGLAIAEERLAEAASRFVTFRGTIDADFAFRLWSGSTTPGDGQVTVRPPASFASSSTPAGIVEALADAFSQDANIALSDDPDELTEPAVVEAPDGADPDLYRATHWLRTPRVALTPQPTPLPNAPQRATGTAFDVEFRPLADASAVRIVVTGYDFDYTPGQEPVTRRIVQDYALTKRVPQAILSPSKVMIGKNVMVEGDLAATFTSTGAQYGDPLVVKSDFAGLDTGLDAELAKLWAAIRARDVDRDNRLRIGHPVEGVSLPDFSSLPGFAAATGADVTQDGYLDEFDVFILYYDGRNGGARDGRVALHAAASAGTPAASLTAEFARSGGTQVDNQLALLIDGSNPDRNRNGEYRFVDRNASGRFDPGTDELLDYELVAAASLPPDLSTYVVTLQSGPDAGQTAIFRDQVLGFRDGVVDRKDQYAKVRGRVLFRATQSAWNAAQPNFMDRIRGPVLPGVNQTPMQFGLDTTALPEINASSFGTARTNLQTIADGATFDQQVAQNLGVSAAALATWTTANNNTDPTAPRLTPLRPDADRDGLPDNWSTAYFEKMPFNSPNFVDWYYRPVYENMIFKNVQIPAGTNALFRRCTFIGVTWVRSRVDNAHINWTNYGKLKLGTGGRPGMDPPRFQYMGTSFPTMLDAGDRPVWMATTPLDKADIPSNEVATTQGYANLPDPLIINNRRVINTKEFSNNLRFHDCLFVGSIVSDAPTNYTNARNKVQFTGGTKFTTVNPAAPTNAALNPDPEDMPDILKSSMMLPQYSVDIGQFNSPDSQDVQLRGAVVAGVLDVRGNADIQGSLILTFAPQLGQAPLLDALGQPFGNPANFNASIGYFGPSDGDEESIDPQTLPLVGGVRIVGWDADGDGLPDYGPSATAPSAAPTATAVPFYGYGRVNLRFDPTMAMPDGILLPLTVVPQRTTYEETRR